MQTCGYGHTFRENVMVRNRASVAMKIQAHGKHSLVAAPGFCIHLLLNQKQVQKPKQIEGELQLET